MALGDNTAFFNETTFLLGDQGTEQLGVSGMTITAVGGGAIDAPAAKVLFTKKAGADTSIYIRKVIDTVRDLEFTINIDARYLDETISVITADRLAVQATFVEGGGTGSENMVLSAKGNNSVGPTLRRLYTLGYV